MKTCKQCNQDKPAREFPFARNFVCLPCHRILAQNWSKIPWPKSEKSISQPKTEAVKKATEARKRQRLQPKSTTISTESAGR